MQKYPCRAFRACLRDSVKRLSGTGCRHEKPPGMTHTSTIRKLPAEYTGKPCASLPDLRIFAPTHFYLRYENMPTPSARIEYIDMAKGFCILLVVFAHIHPDLTRYAWGVFFDSFRMPLYFFLSGIFFKRYSGIGEFGLKKINNLIIPLLFFYALTYLYDALSWGIFRLNGTDTSAYERLSWWPFWEIVRTGSSYHNSPLWFLTALFEVNLLYYALQLGFKSWRLDIAVWGLAVGGWLLAKEGIVLPYYVGTALVALPFFHVGTWLKRGNLLPYSLRDKYLYAALLPLGAAVWLLAEPMRLHELLLPRRFLTFYFCGIGGTLVIVFLSKAIRHLPAISYFGRYSIMVFGTHWPIFHTYRHVVAHWLPDGNPAYILVFVLTMITEVGVIEGLRRYCPRFTAQQECIPTTRFYREG